MMLILKTSYEKTYNKRMKKLRKTCQDVRINLGTFENRAPEPQAANTIPRWPSWRLELQT